MPETKLMELGYYDPQAEVRLNVYADTLMFDTVRKEKTLSAVRFGGYPESVQAIADVIFSGGTIETRLDGKTQLLKCMPRGYRRQLAHDGVYATATLMANDDTQTAATDEEDEENLQEELQPRTCYLFCPAGDKDRLYEELDRKTAAPLIPAFRDYVLDALIARGDLRQMTVLSLRERMDAWVLQLLPEDRNVIEVLERGVRGCYQRHGGHDRSRTPAGRADPPDRLRHF
ncbi:hypothetical protein H8790_11740 [Oscillibacter hominis]|uniref:Uncharacterized protein n=1 Tax=Oscillibacter hominis TaxID=2763056 RepID=A0A7G9B3G8_9FIRM|nr:hypothetical protein [Oscillibacter hominis]QNL44099.1 hypothetical protein H8790_11740 [Oscillibacter hominis]